MPTSRWIRAWSGCVAVAALAACGPSPVRSGAPAVDIGSDPEQENVRKPEPVSLDRDGWRWILTPRAHYVLRAQVLSAKAYHTGPPAELAPCDLAVGWGPLIQGGGYRALAWSQSDRWYTWQYPSVVQVDNDFIVRHSANTHVIPASDSVRKAACRLKAGDLVELDGDLVDVHGEQGARSFNWNSSLARDDRGAGSCEVMYVRRVTVDGNVYE